MRTKLGMCSRCFSSNVECVQIFENTLLSKDQRKTINIFNYKEGRYICRQCLGDPK